MGRHPVFTDDSILFKCRYHPKTIYQFKAIPIKISTTIFAETEKAILKSIWKLKGSWILNSQSNLAKKRTMVEVSHFPISKLTTKLNKRMWYWHKDRHTDQVNRIQIPEINPQIYGQIISTIVPNPFNGGKDCLFNK